VIGRTSVLVACAAALALSPDPLGNPRRSTAVLPPDLVQAIDAFDRAQVSADTATLSRLVTDDYVLVNSDATIDRKAKYLADFLLPGLRMDPYVIEQRIEKAWDGTAVVFGLQRLSWTQDGVRHRRVLRIVHVWTKRSGRWRVTHTQLTRVPG
jgi:ketosteroid isomerase-like protein